ncbi:hypothetical protein NDU88_010241 [Pleurodeles waltl]|uniref:Uncharacterized protein n=1 Tax=Pleurodeles waltl TaxID=8319 RepID=A0AAV7QTV0_PLEWA|nr:hypothetical protein NDU88_010241 [Pleurodeles waltl]
MGKSEQKQSKLLFEPRKNPRLLDRAGPEEDVSDLQEETMQSSSIKAMFLDLKQSLAGIDTKLDHLTDHMDRLKDRVDNHDLRLDQLEHRTSDLEDGRNSSVERLLQMEKVLEVVRNKNEDLEACSLWKTQATKPCMIAALGSIPVVFCCM